MSPYELLDMGFYLFPVSGKMPLVKWTKESTNDPQQIRKWESLSGRTGWGCDCGKSGFAVLDIDSGKVRGALETLSGLEFELPPTLTVKTPSGGYHQIFRGAIKNSASTKLGAGLDTRGVGGFIVAPGSPGYEIISGGDIVTVPEWLVELVGRPAERKEVEPPSDVVLDSDTAIQLAIRFLESADPAIEGLGGDLHTFKVACGVRDYGVSQDTALELMLNHWNDTCSPHWEPEQLEAKIRNAYAYAREPLGSANPENVFEAFIDTDPNPPESTKSVRPLFIDAHDLIRRELTINYLVHGLIETPTTGLIFGDPGAGKSFLAIDLGLSIAFGTSWMGAMSAQGPVLYFNGEGHVGVQRRIQAWLKHYGHQDIAPGLFTLTQRRVELTEKSVMQLEPHIKAIVDKYGPLSMIVVDTLARHLSGDADENSAKDIGGFINAVDYLKDRFQCTVATVHHSGKMNKESSRGSSAIKGALDWEFKVAAGEVKFTKQKEGELPRPMGFRLESVEIGDGVTSAVPLQCEYDPTHGKVANLSKDAELALSLLQFVISTGGGPGLSDKAWRTEFYDALPEDLAVNSKKQKFQRAKAKLVETDTVREEGGFFFDNSLTSIDNEN